MDQKDREQRDLDYLLYNKVANDKEKENSSVSQKRSSTSSKKTDDTEEIKEGVSFLGRPLKHWKLWGAISWILVILYFTYLLTR